MSRWWRLCCSWEDSAAAAAWALFLAPPRAPPPRGPPLGPVARSANAGRGAGMAVTVGAVGARLTVGRGVLSQSRVQSSPFSLASAMSLRSASFSGSWKSERLITTLPFGEWWVGAYRDRAACKKAHDKVAQCGRVLAVGGRFGGSCSGWHLDVGWLRLGTMGNLWPGMLRVCCLVSLPPIVVLLVVVIVLLLLLRWVGVGLVWLCIIVSVPSLCVLWSTWMQWIVRLQYARWEQLQLVPQHLLAVPWDSGAQMLRVALVADRIRSSCTGNQGTAEGVNGVRVRCSVATSIVTSHAPSPWCCWLHIPADTVADGTWLLHRQTSRVQQMNDAITTSVSPLPACMLLYQQHSVVGCEICSNMLLYVCLMFVAALTTCAQGASVFEDPARTRRSWAPGRCGAGWVALVPASCSRCSRGDLCHTSGLPIEL